MADEPNYAAILLVLIMSYLLAMIIGGWMFKLAVDQVVQIFRKHGALSRDSAKSAGELKLEQKRFQVRIKRDYKPQALGFLISRDVIMRTHDDRLYLSERNLLRFQNNES
jgi:hypothetical protein